MKRQIQDFLLHAKHAAATHPRIVIQSPDTDVAVLSVAHFSDLNCQELWLKTGVKDRLRYLPVHEIQAFLRESLCRCLPSFHALTGCDSTSAFSGIGKKKAWKVLLTKEQMQRDLCTLGQNPAIHEPAQKADESFICSLYTSESCCFLCQSANYMYLSDHYLSRYRSEQRADKLRF